MGKLYFIALVILCTAFGHSTCYAQGAIDSTTFILTSRKVCVGDTIEIPVRTVHFRRVAGFQFAISWAPGQFRFLGISNSIFPRTEFDFAAPASGTRVNVAWFKSDGTFSTLPDTTRIFVLRLVALQPGNPASLGFVTNPRDQTAPVIAQYNQVGNNIREFPPVLIGNTIQILPLPLVQATPDTITCRDPFVFLNAQSSDSLATYAWSGPNGYSSTLARDTAFIPGRYQVIATTDSLCASVPLDIVIGFDQTQPVAPTLRGDSINCLRREVQLGFSPVNNTLEYYWITPQNDTLPDPLAPTSLGGTYRLIVVQPSNGCQNSADFTVVVDTLAPSIQLSGQGQLDCRSQSVLLNAGSTSKNLSYTWRNGMGGTVSQDSFLRVNTAGSYQLSVRNTSNACQASKDTSITADTLQPSATLDTTGKITCINRSTALRATVSSNRVETFWISPSLLDTLSRSTSTTAFSGGRYTFLVVDTVNGCDLRLTTTVESDTLRPFSLIQVQTPFSCANPTATLAVDVLPSVTYTWSGQGISGANMAATVQVNTPGQYSVVLSNANNGCTFSDAFQLGGNTDGPQFDRINLKQPPCATDGRGSIGIDLVSGGVAPYTFSLQDSTFASQRNFNNLAPGTYRIKVQDAAGCEGDTSLTILASLPIEVSITAPNNEIAPGDSLQLTAVLGDSTGLASLQWVGSDLAPCDGCNSIQVNPTRSTVYQVQVLNTNGCRSQAVFNVFVVKKDQVYAPTAFSPNGDSKNDRFYLLGKRNLRIVQFRIFDRWGNLVYEASNGTLNDETIGWDGTYGGKVVPPGTFVWIAELETEDQVLQSYSGEAILLK